MKTALDLGRWRGHQAMDRHFASGVETLTALSGMPDSILQTAHSKT